MHILEEDGEGSLEEGTDSEEDVSQDGEDEGGEEEDEEDESDRKDMMILSVLWVLYFIVNPEMFVLRHVDIQCVCVPILLSNSNCNFGRNYSEQEYWEFFFFL